MIRYLSRTEAAARIGVAAPTLSRYRLPEPDAMVGKVRGWTAATIDRWHAARPGSPGRKPETTWPLQRSDMDKTTDHAGVGEAIGRDLQGRRATLHLVDHDGRRINTQPPAVAWDGNDVTVTFDDVPANTRIRGGALYNDGALLVTASRAGVGGDCYTFGGPVVIELHGSTV